MKKTQKSFRKKALLSSLSMLLVSTVAVGSATFAWFTSNKSVTASGMSVKAAAATGLQITKDNANEWAPSVTFTPLEDANMTISPVSLSYSNGTAFSTLGTPIFPTSAEKDGKWTELKDSSFTGWDDTTAQFPDIEHGKAKEAVGSNKYFVAYKVGIKSTGAAISGVKGKVTFTETPSKEYMRIAVVKSADSDINTTDGTTTPTATTWDSDTVKAAYGKETAPVAITDVTPVETSQATLLASDASFDVGVVDQNKAQWYTILIWFEGQDAQCVDANQALTGNVSINFYYV